MNEQTYVTAAVLADLDRTKISPESGSIHWQAATHIGNP